MKRMALWAIACLVVLSLLCVGLFGRKSDDTSSVSTTTTTALSADTTTKHGTTAEDAAVQTTTTLVAGNATTTAATTTESNKGTVSGDRTTKSNKATTSTVMTTSTVATTSTTEKKSVTTTTATGKVTTPLTPIAAKDYYGYSVLKKQNRTAMIEAYECIVQAVEAMQTKIDFTTLSKPLTQDELYTVWTYYRLDYPQHFWMSHDGYTCTMSGSTGEVKTMTVTYAMTKTERAVKQAAVDRAADAILSAVSGNDTPFERERIIHDALCEKVTYDLKAARGHDMDGALVDGKAVCEGYSQAFQYLLYRAGVLCGGVVGKKVGGENHKWNFVVLGNKAYYVDVTWDDLDIKDSPILGKYEAIHSYFNISEQLLLRDHVIHEKDSYPLPNCNSLDENYYKKNGTYITTRSVDELAALLKKGNGMAEIYVADGDTDGYYGWFKSNHLQIAEKLGFTSYAYGYSRTGAGMVIYMKSK